MAINAVILDVLVRLARRHQSPCRLAALGYPDMLVTEAQLEKICGADIFQSLRFRDDSDAILGWHGLRGRMSRVVESDSLFRALGIEVEYLDIHASRGFEIEVDLNEPLDSALAGRYELVYDGGTMEHCFNVGQVMRNVLRIAKVGGHILHVNPINMYNHGFFGFSPTFYCDWYLQGGHKLISSCIALHGHVLESRTQELDPVRSIPTLPERSTLMVAAQKMTDEIRGWPTQTKYLKTPGLKA